MTTKFYPISYDTSYFSREQFIKNVEEEYQEELEGLTVEDGYDSIEEAIANAEVDNLIYEVRWQNGEILDYEIMKDIKITENDIALRTWLSLGGGLCFDSKTNSLYTSCDEGELKDWYAERGKDYLDMSMEEYLKFLARNALERAKINKDKIEEYLTY